MAGDSVAGDACAACGDKTAGDQTQAGGKVMTRAAFSAALVLVGAISVAQQSASPVPLGARLKLRWHGSTVYLREGNDSHELSLRDQFHAVQLDKVTLQSAKEAGDFIYLLLDVNGPSKVPGDSHQCGAGMESDLIWLKLSKDWKVLNAKNFHYDSCWATISADDPPKWEGDTLRVSVYAVTSGTGRTLVATYSYKRPEEGLKIAEMPVTQ